MQNFKGDPLELKFQAAGGGVMDLVAIQRDAFFDSAYDTQPLGDLLYNVDRVPLSKAIKQSIFRDAYTAIFEAFIVAGSFESYLTVFRKIFGTDVQVTFTVPAPGKLQIDIVSSGLETSNFVARTVVDNSYVYDNVIYDDGVNTDNIVFQTVKGFQSQYELQQMLFEMVPGGVFTEITLSIVPIVELIDDLISFWDLEALEDLHGPNDLTGTSPPGTVVAGGHFGNTRELNGTNQYLLINSATVWGVANAWTFAMWFKQDVAADQCLMQLGLFWDQPSNFRILTYGVTLQDSAGVTFKEYIGITNSTAWRHRVVTWDGTDLKIYDNGVDITGPLTKTVDDPGVMADDARYGLMGISAVGGTPAEYFDGLLDIPSIWARALTADEVAEIYNGGAGLNYPF